MKITLPFRTLYHAACCLAAAMVLASCAAPKAAAPSAPAAPGVAAQPAAPAVQRDSVKILSINTLHALHDEASVRRFAAWIKSMQPDVVAVQQIERPMEGKKDFDAVRQLAQALEMHMAFGMARYYKGFDSGNAVFSQYPIHQSSVESIPSSKGKVRRSVAYAVIDVGLQSVGFGSTELEDQSAAERKSQARSLVNLLPQFGDFPFVLCGEFNERQPGVSGAVMKEKFTSACDITGAPDDVTQRVYSAARLVTPVAVWKTVAKDIHSDALVVTLRVVSQ